MTKKEIKDFVKKYGCNKCHYGHWQAIAEGKPCCTFIGKVEIKDGKCLSKRRNPK